MKLDKSQIIPFPFPTHLALFIAAQLKSPIEKIGADLNIKAKCLHVNRSKALGKMILRCLEETNKPQFISRGLSMYISASKNLRIDDKKITEARSSFVHLSPTEIKDMTDVFETLFRTEFIAFVSGAHFGNDYKKGKIFKAITTFLTKYNLDSDKSAVENYRKYYNRHKNTSKTLIDSFL